MRNCLIWAIKSDTFFSYVSHLYAEIPVAKLFVNHPVSPTAAAAGRQEFTTFTAGGEVRTSELFKSFFPDCPKIFFPYVSLREPLVGSYIARHDLAIGID